MVKKYKHTKNNKIKTESYLFLVLTLAYILGISSGCYFILNNYNNLIFAKHIILNKTLNSMIYLITILLFKYSGILNVLLYTIPFFIGIQNSVLYCNKLTDNNRFILNNLHTIIKDTAILFLIILYLIITLLQILCKKYNIKKDIKYFSIYICGIIIIHILYSISLKFII